MAHLKIVVGVLVLTVTVLLNTRPAQAANCANDAACKNGGTCPTPLDSAVCDCSASKYAGETCETDVCTVSGAECLNGATCDETATPNVCNCATGFTGKTCNTKSGASAVTSFSLMSLLVVLTRYIL